MYLLVYAGTFDDADGYRGFADAVASRQRVAAEVSLVDAPDVQRCLQVIGKVLQKYRSKYMYSIFSKEGRSLKRWCFIPLATIA